MKEPKRARKALDYFHTFVDYLEYYMGKIPKEDRQKLIYIEETISELSIDEKIKNIRLATKLKALWNEQHDS